MDLDLHFKETLKRVIEYKSKISKSKLSENLLS
jgi:hypothetical protein